MKRHIFGICAISFAILLTGIVVFGDGYADTPKRMGNGSKFVPRSGNEVTISGVVNGSLDGRIRVHNREVVITDDTRIYRTGKGLVNRGTLVVDSPVYVIGVRKRNATYAKLVIVSDQMVSNRGGKVRVIGADEDL
jgi:hypothetical protein